MLQYCGVNIALATWSSWINKIDKRKKLFIFIYNGFRSALMKQLMLLPIVETERKCICRRMLIVQVSGV